jgi:uncharacterized protein (TIGR03083 family)
MWPTIRAERAALASDLASLSDAQWQTPSLCEGWSVRDVLAHMAATAMITPSAFFAKLAASGFSMRRMQAKDIATVSGATPAETLGAFASVVGSTKHPPAPAATWLGETLVHAEDIRRPLGVAHTYPVDEAMQVADFYKGSNLAIGAKKRIAGVRLRASDATWSHGDGPEASGPIMSLVCAMAGRKAALDDLSGDGVATLLARS